VILMFRAVRKRNIVSFAGQRAKNIRIWAMAKYPKTITTPIKTKRETLALLAALDGGEKAKRDHIDEVTVYPKNRIWPVPVWLRIGHFQWDDPGSTAHRRSPYR
jgi:hypothetical protein